MMIDDVDFAAPFGLLGRLADALLLNHYMTRFLVRHNEHFKRMAEVKADDPQAQQLVAGKSNTIELAPEA